MRVGLLGTINSPILGGIAKELIDANINIDCFILDSKIESYKDLSIFKERTGNKLPFINLSTFIKKNIRTIYVNNHNSNSTINLIKDLKLDLLLNAGTPRILKLDLLNSPSIGVLNCHPGLLPKYRGCTCVEWAIYNDHKIGNTVHLMTEEIDLGQIIIKEELEFKKTDDYQDIRKKVYESGFKLFAKAINKIETIKFDNNNLHKEDWEYYKVIDSDKMRCVISKINNGKYLYQK